MGLPRLPIQALDDVNFRRKHRETTNLILNHQHDDSRIQTPGEIAAGVTPVNYAYPPGNVLRYGADRTGVSDSQPAFYAACRSSDYVYVPIGDYLFNSELVVDRSNITIFGENRGKATSGAPDADSPGASIRLSATAGPGAAAIRFTSAAVYQCVEITGLKILLKNHGLENVGIRIWAMRNSQISRCWIEGLGDAVALDDDTYGIWFEGGDLTAQNYTGDVEVKHNFISNHLNAIRVDGYCTTVMIMHNTMVGTQNSSNPTANPTEPEPRAIRIANTSTALLIQGNTIDGWYIGVYSEGGWIKQVANYFDFTTHAHFQWVRGAGNSEIYNCSLWDSRLNSPPFSWIVPNNNVDGCFIVNALNHVHDAAYIEAGLGFRERLRTVNLGEWTTPSYSGANFAAIGAMTWTVDAGDVTANQYTHYGKTMVWNFSLVSTSIGGTPDTTLTIVVPGSYTIARDAWMPIRVLNGGSYTTGWAYAQGGSTVLRLYVDATAATNYVAGATEVHGQLQFEVQ